MPLRFFYLGANAILFQRRQIFDENLAFEMVHFMLDAYAQEVFRVQSKIIAVSIQCFYRDFFGTRHDVENTRDR